MINEFVSSVADAPPHLTAIETLFGSLVPAEETLVVQLTHRLEQGNSTFEAYRVQVGLPVWASWTLHVVWPAGKEACPLLLSPDGCWPHVVHTGAIDICTEAGVAMVWFDRTELAWDRPDGQRAGPVHERWPERSFGALMVWAWGINRSLQALMAVSVERIGSASVVGHSRGGKAALLAAVLDCRWNAVISHNSGTGGAASMGPTVVGAESLADLALEFPHWLAADMSNQELLAEFQMHLQALNAPCAWLQTLAPRGLCVLQAEDDFWANPTGTAEVVERLRTHWTGRPLALQHHARSGGHAMTLADWKRAVAFTCQMHAL